MGSLVSKIRSAMGQVRETLTAEDEHESALRRLEEQRVRLARVDAVLDSNRASQSAAARQRST